MRLVVSACAVVGVAAAALVPVQRTPAAASCGWTTFPLGVFSDRAHPAGMVRVAAVSSSDVWAVGSRTSRLTGQRSALIDHWDGRRWTFSPVPDPLHNQVVSAVAARKGDAWAVGRGSRGALTLHWIGNRWSVVSNPAGPGSILTDVAMVSPSDVWASGPGLMLHWDGSKWSKVAGPFAGDVYGALAAIPGTSDVWVFGTDPRTGEVASLGSPSSTSTAVESWQTYPLPTKTGAHGYNWGPGSIAAASPSSAWIVQNASMTSAGGRNRTFVLHWNGSIWAEVASPNPSPLDDELDGVAARSDSDAWAIGLTRTSSAQARQLVLRWNGTTWTKVTAPTSGVAVATVPGSKEEVWIVGPTLERYRC